jgi:hypothetical protein
MVTIQDVIDACRAARRRFDEADATMRADRNEATIAAREEACVAYGDSLDDLEGCQLHNRGDVRALLRFIADDEVALNHIRGDLPTSIPNMHSSD